MLSEREVLLEKPGFFFLVDIEVHGLLWFSTVSTPHPRGYVQKPIPVLHNYPLMLAIKGIISEGTIVDEYKPNYVGGYAKPSYRDLEYFYEDFGFYVYPAVLRRAYYVRLFMSMSETDYVVYKPQTRSNVPITTIYNAIGPGSRLITFLLVDPERFKPPRFIVTRIGVKRYGVLKMRLTPLNNFYLDKVPTQVNHPFNIKDVSKEGLRNYFVVLKHKAGDVAYGCYTPVLKTKTRRGEYILALPKFIELEE